MATTPSSTAGGNTPTNSQWNPGKKTKYTMQIPGLQPGLTYNLVVWAENTTGRSDYAVKTYSVPLSDASGSNGVVYNKGQDIRLQGGSIFATTSDSNALPKNLGQINILGTAPTGRGLIINQTGIGAFRDGVAQFRLSAVEGTAEFAGKVSAGQVKIGPDIDPTETKSGIYINANNYWYDDGSFKTTSENVTRIITGVDAKKPGAPTNFVAAWAGQDLILTFNFDTTFSSDTIDNTHIQFFVFTYKLLDGTFRSFKMAPSGTLSQNYGLTFEQNKANFGRPQTAFDQIIVVAEDIYGNQGPAAILEDPPSYTIPLPVPTISVTNSNNGYSVNFTNYPNIITYPSFSKVLVEEFVSSSNIDPGDVAYTTVYEGLLNPAVVITPTTAQRWVRARYMDSFGAYTSPSTAYKANPVNPVASNLDLQPPNDVQVGTVAWVGNNIEISYSLPATDSGERFVIALTTNYAPYDDPALTGFFYKYPDPSGKIIITQDELFGQFGGYYTGYSGLFKSADAADNRTAGVSFIVPVKQSSISNLTPDLNLINVFGVPNGYVVQPYLVAGASSMEIYESTTSTGPWTLKANTSQLYAATVTSYNTKYLRFRWTGAFGDFSLFTLAKAANPIDPTAFSTIPPDTPSVGVVTANKTSLDIAIDTIDTVKTKGYFLKYFPTAEPTDITTETISSNGAGTINFTIKNLSPGTSYTVSAAGYNDSNIVGNYSANQVFATITATVSVPVSVALTGASYGALASWSAPSSPETVIDQYKVAVYTSAGVLFTEQFTAGTTFSVSGLKASTSYYVKVSSKDIFGNLSAEVQSNTITLNAVGGTNDGLPVATSPTPVITPLFGALQVKWDAVTNVDSVTYEVHVSTTSGFTPDRPLSGTSTTRVIQTEGTFAIVKTLPSGVSLNYDTLYYVRIVAKDFDGAAGPSTQASGTPSKVDNGDIAANAVRANQIFAGSVSADKVDSANLLVSKLFSVGSGGTFAIKIDATGDGTTTPYKLYSGSGSYYDAGTAFYLDSLGKFSLKDKLFFDGTTLNVNGAVIAQSGYFNGPITVNGFNPATAMKIGRNVSGSNDGISLDSNNYWYTNGRFRVGSSTLGVSWDGTSTFAVTGDITANSGTFKGAVTIDDVQANAGLWVLGLNANYTSGPRVVINKNGLYAYNFGATTGQAASTYINLAASAGAYTFVTENAQIGGWTVDSNKIEKLTGTNYSGIATGSSLNAIAFYAGSTGSGGNNTAKFSVTQGGAVIARDISILGDGTADTKLQIGGTSSTAPFTVDAAGNMKATQATIEGNITAKSGTFSGNVFIGTAGSLYSGSIILPSTPQAPTSNTLAYPVLSSAGFILNKAGITFSNGTDFTTTISSANGLLQTSLANIGGWNVNATQINNGGIVLDTSMANPTGANGPGIYAQKAGYHVGMAPATNNTTDAVLWAGTISGPAARNGANFRVDATGKFTALEGVIGSNVLIGLTNETIATMQANASSAASKPKAFRQDNAPSTSGVPENSIWFDTNDSNKPYLLVSGQWVLTSIDKAGIALANVENYDAAGQAKNGIEAGAAITKGGITLSSTGSIKAGQTAYDTGTGFYLGADSGTPRFSIGNSAGNKMTWDGTALSIKGSVTATSGSFEVGFFGKSTNRGYWTVGADINGTITSSSFYQAGYDPIVLDAWNGSITGGRITGSVIEGTTLKANTINAGSAITGGIIRTSTNATRVEMRDDSDSFVVRTSSTIRGHITGAGAAGILMHYGTTVNTAATTYGLFLATSNSATMAGDSANFVLTNGGSNYTQVSGTRIDMTGGVSGTHFTNGSNTDTGSVYFEKTRTAAYLPDTTASNANAFLNSTSGLIARSTSSRKYKTNIESTSFSDSTIKSLRPVKYQGIGDLARGDDTWFTGLIAEEVALIPGLELLVNYNEDGTPEAVNYAGLSVVLADIVSRILDRLDKAGI